LAFRRSSVLSGICDTSTCRFEGFSREDGLLELTDLNITSSTAYVFASMVWAHSFLAATMCFCRLESNGDHNGIVLDDLPDDNTLSNLLFLSNRCEQTTRTSIQGLLQINSATTFRDCVFLDNAVECVAREGSQLPLVQFERCVFDDHYPVARAVGCNAPVLTIHCEIGKMRAAQLLAPWPDRTTGWATRTKSRPTRSRTQSFLDPPTRVYDSGGSGGSGGDSGGGGGAGLGILVIVLIIIGVSVCGGAGGTGVVVIIVTGGNGE
jgi:uncharacterized membrane protein YgcG